MRDSALRPAGAATDQPGAQRPTGVSPQVSEVKAIEALKGRNRCLAIVSPFQGWSRMLDSSLGVAPG